MKKSQKLSRLLHFSGLALLAVVALFSTAQSASAQELVRGIINLPMAAKLGDTDLPPGVYRFSVLSLNTINSLESIQVGNSRVMVALNGPSKDSHVVSLLANASKSAASNSQTPSSLEFGVANAIRSISLTNLGLTIDFTGKQAGDVVRAAQVTEPSAAHSGVSASQVLVRDPGFKCANAPLEEVKKLLYATGYPAEAPYPWPAAETGA